MKRLPCKNHPTALTPRKCFQCHEPICSTCQLNLDHHLFCGHWCYVKWRGRSFSATLHLSKELITLFVLLVVSNISLLIYFNFKFDNLITDQKKEEVASDQPLPSEIPKIKIDRLRYPQKNMIQLQMSIPAGDMVVLKRDGRFVDSKIQKQKNLLFSNQYLNQGDNYFAIYLMEKNNRISLLDSFTVSFNSLRVDYLRHSLQKISGDSNGIALTFDGGSTNHQTETILNILREHQVRCTMFLTGSFLKKYPDAVQQMINDGHEIGNHSFNHPHLTRLEVDGTDKTREGIDRSFVINELLKTDSLFQVIAQRPMAPYWRAPFGEINQEILLWAAESGFMHVGWSEKCDTWDWVADSTSNLYRSANDIYEHLIRLEENEGLGGKIILMHLGSDRKKDFPHQILGALIKELQSKGYVFKTISQLLSIS